MMCIAHGDQNRVLGTLILEQKMAERHHEGIGNQTWIDKKAVKALNNSAMSLALEINIL